MDQSPLVGPNRRRLAGAPCVRPTRLLRSAIVLKPSTLLALHKAMSKQEYRMLFSPNRRRKPGPKGPSVETHSCGRRNEAALCDGGLAPNRTTEGLAVHHSNRQRRDSKDSRPSLPAGTGLRWSLLADFPGPNERQSLEHGSVQLRVGHVAVPLGPGGHGSIHAPEHWFWPPCGKGRWCRTLSDVQPRHSRATREAEVRQLRQRSALSVPPMASQSADTGGDRNQDHPLRSPSHPFVERLIGTIRREYLDHILFWTTADLENKLLDFRTYFNNHRTHTSREGRTPDTPVSRPIANPRSFRWQPHCRALYQTPVAA